MWNEETARQNSPPQTITSVYERCGASPEELHEFINTRKGATTHIITKMHNLVQS